MSTPEERRQRILANSEARLAKLRHVTLTENTTVTEPMAPISKQAPAVLLKKSPEIEQPRLSSSDSSSSPFSSLISLMNFFSPSPKKPTVENSKDFEMIDRQHLFVCLLGIIVSILYSFYIAPDSNLFFHLYLLCTIGLLTLRYAFMQMKHRTNVIISTIMLSGFKPSLVKKGVLIYTLLVDAWIIFALYFVSFCFTYALLSLF